MLEKVSRGEVLSASENEAWERAQARVDRICHYAHQVGVPVMLDAEETWIQDAIDHLAYTAMSRYNREKVIVFNTIQCYRTGRLAALDAALENAQKEGYGLGIKFVRGAYMEKERARAQQKNLPSPIQPTKEATDAEFNACVARMISVLGRPEDGQKLACMIGSHNEDSASMAAELLTAQGWTPESAPVWFAQLYGMSDHISFVMAHHGFRVAKYLPFGPIEAVMPYLFRRAEENTSVKGQTGRELGLIQTEQARRSSAKRGK
jgi:proline dehydrogenase